MPKKRRIIKETSTLVGLIIALLKAIQQGVVMLNSIVSTYDPTENLVLIGLAVHHRRGHMITPSI